MPKWLKDRIGDDTVAKYEAAARLRSAEGLDLLMAGRRLGGIYLLGYAGEMVVKAAYFHSVGHVPTQTVTPAERNRARGEWRALNLLREPGQHDIEGWAQLLVAKRADLGRGYPADLSNDLVTHASGLHRVWCEVLRYRGNAPYPHEVKAAVQNSLWLLSAYEALRR